MTRMHFEAIAAALLAARPGPGTFAPIVRAWEATVHELAKACAEFNHAFDPVRFHTAAGCHYEESDHGRQVLAARLSQPGTQDRTVSRLSA